MTDETGNNDVRDELIVHTNDATLTMAPDERVGGTTSQSSQPCLRDNECSQQQLVRLVGYRAPIANSSAWDRLRREQAALLAAS